ncbi:MAG: alkaline phosphatase family protein, partial [Anaerolineaceae bacterium]|nr:alkaline phosphatase family protein [Anaerolineaceae bacterium]
MRRILVINCAALSADCLADPAVTPHLHRLAGHGQQLDLAPSFPAVTCSVQATLTTGCPPAEHGIVANGFYLRNLAEVRFWEQPASLVQAPPFWARSAPRPRVAMLFWQNSLYADLDCMITPKPLHTEAGLINDCYSQPRGLYGQLREQLGDFPLHHYWGPMAGPGSSRWIAGATEHVWREREPDICLTYLPHLDYNTQRRGPDPAGLADDLGELDEMVGRLAEMARGDGARVVVLSEYSLSPVSRAVALNRVLREAGLLAVRELEGREYLDCGASPALAMVDHQVAHIYFPAASGPRRAATVARVRDLLLGTDGVAEVLDARAQTERGIRHQRSGALVCTSEPDAWFSYYWWFDDARAPQFARTVDIHNKPGYDPVELFVDPETRGIPLDASGVRGSHGRAGPDDPKGVLLVTDPPDQLAGRTSVRADQVAALVLGRGC